MLEGKRIAILVEQDFEDTELIEPPKVMKAASAKVLTVGSGSQESYQGKWGMASIRVDTNSDKVRDEDFGVSYS